MTRVCHAEAGAITYDPARISYATLLKVYYSVAHDPTQVCKAPIVTKLEALHAFYPAEEYHQHFYDRNPDYPYIVDNDKPKVAQLHARFPESIAPGK